MKRQKPEPTIDPAVLASRVRPPVAIVLGSPSEVTNLVASLNTHEIVCYQMDLYQAARLREEFAGLGVSAEVATGPDLWDLPADFRTVIYPAPLKGERDLKIDMVEQAFHILKPHGQLIVLSGHETDRLFPLLLKKIFGKVRAPAAGQGMMFCCQREGDGPRRRHEVSYRARFDEKTSFNFLSRPGVFSYGRFDDGARALIETMRIDAGDRVLDLGCGCGTNGIFAARLSGPTGHTIFIDSNVRAIALTEINARGNGVTSFEAIGSESVQGVEEGSMDVVLANPPYYAQSSIAQLFIERSQTLLRPGGRFFLVTKQPDQIGPMVAERFGVTEPVLCRGYTVLCACVTVY